MQHTADYDTLIIGSGAAGLSLALRLPSQLRIAIIAKGPLSEGSTQYAQGGISAVLSEDDSIESHVQDTLRAGDGLCDEAAVRFTVQNGPAAIQWLIDQGVQFTTEQNSDNYHLTREGGHSHRRVIHADDATGREVATTLESLVRDAENIDLFEHHLAIDLITAEKLSHTLGHTPKPEKRAYGAYVLDADNRRIITLSARATILATGGANKTYLYTSNPHTASGDGIAMAARAGCRISNMEFMQFHPTCLYHTGSNSFLLTEAIRGEGGKLTLPNGQPFMHHFHAAAELAPRDVVARAIDHVMKEHGIDHVLLNISHQPTDWIIEKFPNIHERCLSLGLDMTQTALPVVPAAHYTCGGVLTDLNGCTDLAGLYAIGETACTGLHGANRMASNSLLECLVFAASAAEHITQHIADWPKPPALPAWDASRVTRSREHVIVSHNWDELRRVMWNYVGIVRNNNRLERAAQRVGLLKQEIDDYYTRYQIDRDLIELRNLIHVAELIIRSAQSRQESRGLHYTLDYPATQKIAENTVL